MLKICKKIVDFLDSVAISSLSAISQFGAATVGVSVYEPIVKSTLNKQEIWLLRIAFFLLCSFLLLTIVILY